MQLKLVTYNIGGLPEVLDLRELPWLLRPVAWIYRWLKGTTLIHVNSDGRSDMTERISEYCDGADIVAVQEDFNYHDDLLSHLQAYQTGRHGGEVTLRGLFSRVEWRSLFPLPRLKADGLCLLVKPSRVEILQEETVGWRKSCGYFGHANDALTHKGFRYYQVSIDGTVLVDVYNVHMDADFGGDNRKDYQTRYEQVKQLTEYIADRAHQQPVIIMGDTNADSFFMDALLDVPGYTVTEARTDRDSIDRIYLLNTWTSQWRMAVMDSWQDMEAGKLSDHYPTVAVIEITHR